MWSTGGMFIKILTLDAWVISFYRSLIAGITIMVVSAVKKNKVKYSFDGTSLACMISYAGILILFVAATKITTAANAIFLQYAAPIYLVFLEPLFLKTKFDKKSLITVIICLCGMALFFFGRIDAGNMLGNILAICSGLCFAFFSLFLKWKKKNQPEDAIGNVVMGNMLVAVICLPLVFMNLIISPSQFLILLFLGAIQIGISYMIYNEGLKYVSATQSMIIGMLEAVFNPVWVFLSVGERPSIFAIEGGAIILAAVLWSSLTSNRKGVIID